MIRRCELCGSEKRGAEAEFKKEGIGIHDSWWAKMHEPGCAHLKVPDSERMTHFSEHGTPLSSVLEE